MTTDIAEQLQLPRLDQIGFVYKDIEAAIALYDPMFGPFKRMNTGVFEYDYRGNIEPAEVKLAFGRNGDIEIELIEWISGGTPHKEFIDAGREGMHHIRFLVDDLQSTIDDAAPLGYKPIWRAQFAPQLAVAYMERENDPLIIEFFQNAGMEQFRADEL